jgi:hypothetical protein
VVGHFDESLIFAELFFLLSFQIEEFFLLNCMYSRTFIDADHVTIRKGYEFEIRIVS